jgi:hypothetical protein
MLTFFFFPPTYGFLSHSGGTELLLAPPRAKSHTIQLPARISSNSNSSSKVPTPSITAPADQNQTDSDPKAAEEAEGEAGGRPADMRSLVRYIKEEMIVERAELFIDSDGQGM